MRFALNAIVLSVIFISSSFEVGAGDWPHWRGLHHNDVVDERSGWTTAGWNLGNALWNQNVGEGSTSPIVAGGRLYTMGWADNRDTVACLDAASGDVIWTTSYKSPRYGRWSTGDKAFYSGPCATPVYDKQTGYLYTLGIDGTLICWDAMQKGRRRWSVNFYDRYSVKRRPDVGRRRKTPRDYGYLTSPYLFRDSLIVEVGDDEGTLMAFDKRSGKRLWVSECKDEAGHTGGLAPITVAGVPSVAVLTLRQLVVVRLDRGQAGKTIAQHPWTTDYGNNIATPAVYRNNVVITSAYNHFAMCRLKITLSGATTVWERPITSGVCSPVIHRGNIYWAWQGVHCVDFETGERKWTGRKVGAPGSCIVTADDRLIVWADKGDLLLAETAERSPQRYTELAARKRIFSNDAWPHIVLTGGRLYCKDRMGNIKCFKLSAERK